MPNDFLNTIYALGGHTQVVRVTRLERMVPYRRRNVYVPQVSSGGTQGTTTPAPVAQATTQQQVQQAAQSVSVVPSAPVIAQQLMAITAGLQFGFNYELDESVTGYWVYKSSTNDPAASSRWRSFTQLPGGGVCTVQDNVGSAVTAYYWVTALNATNESSKSAAQAGAVASLGSTSNATVYRPSVNTVPTHCANPTAAYDNNMNTYAGVSGDGSEAGEVIYSGIPAATGTPTSVAVKMAYSVSGNALAQYSTDNGSTWTPISLTNDGSQHTATVTLSTGQDLTRVQIDVASATEKSTDWPRVYEIWIEVVT